MRWFGLWLSVAAMGLMATTGCGIALSDGGGGRVETRQDDFSVSGVPTLIVENVSGDVEVTGGADAGKVQVTSRLHRPERLEYQATQDGDTVRITVRKLPAEGGWWSWRWWRHGASDIVVAVHQTAHVDIHSFNGDVSASHVAEAVKLRTVNGNIEAFGVGGAYDLHSTNGNITVTAGQGEFNLHTVNGNIRLAGDPGTGTQSSLETSNGDINVSLTGEAPSVRVDAKTSNGGIEIAGNTAQKAGGRNQIEAAIGGGGAALSLSTSNGSITVE